MENPTNIAEREATIPREGHVALEGVTAYINAGGRGTRLNPLFEPDPRTGISKALLPVGEPPIRLIDHHINKLAAASIQHIVAGVGDHEHVANYVNSNTAYRANVHAATSDKQYGTGGDLIKALRENSDLFGQHIWVNNVDTLLDISEEDMAKVHLAHGGEATIAVTTKQGVPNENAFFVASSGLVLFSHEATSNPTTESSAAAAAEYRASSTGALLLGREMVEKIEWDEDDGPLSLYRDIVSVALASSNLHAYNNAERLFTDVGTVPTWEDAHEHPSEIQPHLYYS